MSCYKSVFRLISKVEKVCSVKSNHELLEVDTKQISGIQKVYLYIFVWQIKVEYTSKLDFLWKSKFSVEKEEVETMGSLNKILLENILPAHVADHFLNTPHRRDVRETFDFPLLEQIPHLGLVWTWDEGCLNIVGCSR